MSVEEKSGARGGVATVMATAAVTAAIGITVATLGGYLSPNRDAGPVESAPAAGIAAGRSAEPSPPAAPRVVLVPVTPTSQRDSTANVPVQPEPEVLEAAYEPSRRGDDEGERHHSRGHSRRHHEDGHDDDD